MPQLQKGKWFTRNNRLVLIDSSREITDPPTPGAQPLTRLIWEGMMYAADGRTEESRRAWEADGRFKTPLGVASQYDLVQLIEATIEPEPVPIPPEQVIVTDFDTALRELTEQQTVGVISQLIDRLRLGDESPGQALARVLSGTAYFRMSLAAENQLLIDYVDPTKTSEHPEGECFSVGVLTFNAPPENQPRYDVMQRFLRTPLIVPRVDEE